MKGLADLKTARHVKMRGMPQVAQSPPIELFMLGKQKERLEKEEQQLLKALQRTQHTLRHLAQRLESLRQEIAREGGGAANAEPAAGEPHGTRGWQTMPLTY
ncbi:MAG: hypothetical protein HYY96_05420 [Candidatus Tectomicrobia bacterium]|nr:hypothetical protein [Candidatus Tectomicrobia bacterium]